MSQYLSILALADQRASEAEEHDQAVADQQRGMVSSDAEWKYTSDRRYFQYVEQALANETKFPVFDGDDPPEDQAMHAPLIVQDDTDDDLPDFGANLDTFVFKPNAETIWSRAPDLPGAALDEPFQKGAAEADSLTFGDGQTGRVPHRTPEYPDPSDVDPEGAGSMSMPDEPTLLLFDEAFWIG